MTAGLFVGHHRGPGAGRVDQPLVIEQRRGVRFGEAGDEALAQQPLHRVAAVRVEAEADHRLAVARHIRMDCDDARRHLAEIDISVGNLGADRHHGVADRGNAHDQVSPGRSLSHSVDGAV